MTASQDAVEIVTPFAVCHANFWHDGHVGAHPLKKFKTADESTRIFIPIVEDGVEKRIPVRLVRRFAIVGSVRFKFYVHRGDPFWKDERDGEVVSLAAVCREVRRMTGENHDAEIESLED